MFIPFLFFPSLPLYCVITVSKVSASFACVCVCPCNRFLPSSFLLFSFTGTGFVQSAGAESCFYHHCKTTTAKLITTRNHWSYSLTRICRAIVFLYVFSRLERQINGSATLLLLLRMFTVRQQQFFCSLYLHFYFIYLHTSTHLKKTTLTNCCKKECLNKEGKKAVSLFSCCC